MDDKKSPGRGRWQPQLTGTGPKYRQIVDALAAAIETGDLRPGDRLPTQRDLAWHLRCNLSTVTRAYKEAARRHLVAGQISRGTFVLGAGHKVGLFAVGEGAIDLIDLSTSRPSLPPDAAGDGSGSLFAGAVKAALADDLRGYHTPDLVEAGRAAVVRWLEWRRLPVPQVVHPCSGAHAGLVSALLALGATQTPVMVEAHTFPGMRAAALHLGLKLVPIECDREGMRPAALLAAIRATGARIAVLVANLQNPTGAVMGAARRQAIAEVVKASGIIVVEDDVYGPLTDRPPLCAELGRQGVLVGSFSKAVLPGLRFGFVAGDAPALSSLSGDGHDTTWFTAPLCLAVAVRWVEDSTAFRLAKWQRDEVRERWCLFERLLGPSSLPPGPHAWLTVPAESAPDIETRCRGSGSPSSRPPPSPSGWRR